MDRARVAAYYRAKGYEVREAVLATGHSGNDYRVPLLCEGPLGNLAIFFGDADGIDEHEMSAARRVAKDLGATAIMAADSFTSGLRAHAANAGVVLLDADAVAPTSIPSSPAPSRPWPEAVAPSKISDDVFADHPWPNSGRPGGRDGGPPTTFEIDELLRDLDKPLRPAATAPVSVRASTTSEHAWPKANSEPSSAPRPQPQQPATGPVDGLWKTPRPMPTPSEPNSPRPPQSAPMPGKFAWLGMQTTTRAPIAPIEVTLEHSDVVQAHDAQPQAQTAPLSKEEAAFRQVRRRMWLRRLAWMGGGATFVYLFLLWWL